MPGGCDRWAADGSLADMTDMKQGGTLLLSGGGVRSLVALAQVLAARPGESITLLHVRDGREAAEARRRGVLAQAEHFHIGRILVIDMPWLTQRPWAKRTGSLRHDGAGAASQHAPLTRLNLLTAAATVAVELRGTRIIWPVTAESAEQAACLSEQAQLIEQAVGLEAIAPPRVVMPLLQSSDVQVVSLGRQMNVPWEAAWSCLRERPVPCGKCGGCLRRRAAFQAAGVEDPVAARRVVMA